MRKRQQLRKLREFALSKRLLKLKEFGLKKKQLPLKINVSGFRKR